MNTKNTINKGSVLFRHLLAFMFIFASLLILPNIQANVGDVFTQDKIQYTVTSEGTLFKRVSVTGHGRDIEIANIPSIVIYNDVIYSVTSIANSAFQDCNSLTNVTVPDGVTSIGEWAFGGCENITDVIVSDSVINIGHNAFNNCVNLKSITLGNGLERLENTVFHCCYALTSIRFPSSLSYIGWDTFDWCTGMEYFEVDETSPYFTTVDGVLFSKDLIRLVRYPAAKVSTEYVVPESITTMDDYCFQSCNNLQKIVFPTNITQIPHGMCENCRNLEEFTIPSKVTFIGSNSFGGCEKIKNIVIPDGVLTIGGGAFADNFALEGVDIPASVTKIDGSPFGHDQLKYLTVDPSNAYYCSVDDTLFTKDMETLICHAAGKECSIYDVPATVKYITDGAFVSHRKLKAVTFPEGLKSIGDWAFDGCVLLENVDLPSTLTRIGNGAFQFCTSLISMTFMGNAPEIGGDAIFNATTATIYYVNGTSGWTNPWYGRPTVAVSTAPTITVQPSSHTVTEGGSVQFAIGVIGTTSFNFQWYKDGKPISGATSASYKIDEVDRNDAGNYFVIVSNEYGTATSDIAVLTVNEGAAPEITVQPINKKVKVGTNTGFSVQASNATGYQWYKNGVAIEGATSRFLELNNVTKEDEGEYFAVAINKSGTAASKVVTLTVMIPPVIIKQPESLSVLEGTEAVFAVEAENATNYQWYKDNSIINGATNAVYAIDVTVKEDSGMYYVNVMHQDLVVKSKEARLDVYSLPVIIQQPESLSVSGGESATFTVKAENVTEYQWYKNGTAISGANQETYTIEAVTGYDVGEYSVVVGNSHSKLGSDVVTLGISEPYRATAEVQIANGYVIGAIVTDPGWGYEFEPKVKIKDEFGEGAEAHCIVENGMIVGIVIDNPGSGYSGESTIKVGSPFKYNSMEIAVKDVLITMHLTFGEMYQLECSKDMKTWEKIGEPFVAEDETVEIVVDVIETGRYFRVHEVK